jgi:HEAT repeat protein
MSRFGGKFSVPIFVELLNKPSGQAQKTIIDELSKYPDPQGAEAVANKLSDSRLKGNAEESLKKMGSVAEPALIKSLSSQDPRVSSAAIALLSEIGTPRSIGALTKASKSKDPGTADAVKSAIKAIRIRARGKGQETSYRVRAVSFAIC